MKYRKKPVVIDAMQLTRDNIGEVKDWCGARYWSKPPMRAVTGLHIETLEGMMVAQFGDYIIRGVKGEFYPCKPDIFAATYEPTGWAQIDHPCIKCDWVGITSEQKEFDDDGRMFWVCQRCGDPVGRVGATPSAGPALWDRECVRCGHKWKDPVHMSLPCPSCEGASARQVIGHTGEQE